MLVNGQKEKITVPCCLADFLVQNNYATEKIAVELNDSIVARKDYAVTFLHNDDKLEIVTFVGGG